MKERKKRRWRRLLWLPALAVLGILAALVVSAAVKSASRDAIVTRVEAADFDADCILVLGAGISSNNRPSPMLADRLEEGIALYEAGVAPKLLMSGDHGQEGYNEVGVMKQYAVDAGVPPEDVFMDHAGFSTYESIYRARDIFLAERVVLVTQEYHLYRALYVAQELGISAVGVASDPRAYAGQSFRELREIAARGKDVLQCILGTKPTLLGDAIPVWEDGNLTND